jgi:hypothetical protein
MYYELVILKRGIMGCEIVSNTIIVLKYYREK